MEPRTGTIALTFDDGPDPVWTPVVLDILKERGATATFFVTGWKVAAHPELARRIVEEGHSLQNHAYEHHDLTAKSNGYIASLIRDAADVIDRVTGARPVCLRPPRGRQNARVRGIAAAEDHAVALWTKDSHDYYLGSAARIVEEAGTWKAGDVVVMHDTWGILHQDALPAILDDLEARGIGTSAICVPNEVLAVPAVQ